MCLKVMCTAMFLGAILINCSKKTEAVTDADGNVYTTVKIGNQIWTVENWRSTKYNDGIAIPNVTGNTQWEGLTTGAYSYYENNPANKVKYGALYNWYAVNTGKIAPKEWRVPSDDDWTKLEEYLIANGYNWDGSKENNRIAKALAAKTDWKGKYSGDIGNDLKKNNASGFSALPGGYRDDGGSFKDLSEGGYWWCTTQGVLPLYAWDRLLSYGNQSLLRYGHYKSCGFSLRLVRDL